MGATGRLSGAGNASNDTSPCCSLYGVASRGWRERSGPGEDSDSPVTLDDQPAKRRRLMTKTKPAAGAVGLKRPREGTSESERFERLRSRIVAKEQRRLAKRETLPR